MYVSKAEQGRPDLSCGDFLCQLFASYVGHTISQDIQVSNCVRRSVSEENVRQWEGRVEFCSIKGLAEVSILFLPLCRSEPRSPLASAPLL
jgi:hypothetical protein